MLHGSALRLTTMTFWMLGVCLQRGVGECFERNVLPARNETFAVMSSLHSESLMRPASESELNPPNTTE